MGGPPRLAQPGQQRGGRGGVAVREQDPGPDQGRDRAHRRLPGELAGQLGVDALQQPLRRGQVVAAQADQRLGQGRELGGLGLAGPAPPRRPGVGGGPLAAPPPATASQPVLQAPSSARAASARPGSGHALAGQHVGGGPAGRGEVAVPGLGQRPPGPGPGLEPGQVARGELPVGLPQRVPGLLDLPAAQPGHPQREPQQPHGAVLGLGAGGRLGPLGQRRGPRPAGPGSGSVRPPASMTRSAARVGSMIRCIAGTARLQRPVPAVQVRGRPVAVTVPEPGGGPRRGDRGVVGGAVRREQGQHALQVRGRSRAGHPGPGLGQGLRRVVPVLRLSRAAHRGDRLVMSPRTSGPPGGAAPGSRAGSPGAARR